MLSGYGLVTLLGTKNPNFEILSKGHSSLPIPSRSYTVPVMFVFLSQIYSSLEVFGKKFILYLGTFVNFMWGPDGLEGVKNNVSDYPAKLQNLFVVLWMLWL